MEVIVKQPDRRGVGGGEEPERQIKVLIADALRILSESLGMALWWWPDFEVLPQYPTTGPEAVDQVVLHKPDVVLLDYWLPEMEGVTATATILKRAPDTKVLLMSWLHGPRDIQKALESGATGFLPKSVRVDQVAGAIQLAYAGQSPVYAAELAGLVRTLESTAEREGQIRERVVSLSPREMEVLRLLSYGRSNTDIGRELQISPGTVKVHLHRILTKMDARTKEEALAMARFVGFTT